MAARRRAERSFVDLKRYEPPKTTNPKVGRPRKPRVIQYRRAPLYPAQERAIFHDQRWGFIEAATKIGKTTGCLIWLTEQAALRGGPGKHFWWTAPIYKQAAIAYERFKLYTNPALFTANDSGLQVQLLNRAIMEYKSAEKADNLYGEDVWAVVMDEVTRMREASWHAIRSTLTFTRGPGRLIGNVRGKANFAWRLGQKAKAGEPGWQYDRLTAFDAVEAGILSLEEVLDAQRSLPESVFRELYLAEPADDGGNPFGLTALKKVYQAHLSTKPPRVWGVDLARAVDWTVAIALDEDRRMCRFHRFQKPWAETIRTLRELIGACPVVIDATGVGDPIVEALMRRASDLGQPSVLGSLFTLADLERRERELKQALPTVIPFRFNSASKQALMEAEAIAIQQGEVGIWPGEGHSELSPGLIAAEFESFQYEYSRTGVTYSAPEGLHDDCVIAHALALEGARVASQYTSRVGAMVAL